MIFQPDYSFLRGGVQEKILPVQQVLGNVPLLVSDGHPMQHTQRGKEAHNLTEDREEGHLNKTMPPHTTHSQTHLPVSPLGSQKVHQQSDLLLTDEVDGLRTVFKDAAQQVQQFCRHRMGMGLQWVWLQWVGLQWVGLQ